MSEMDMDVAPLSCCFKHGLFVPLITWYGQLMWIDCPHCKDERWAEEKRIIGLIHDAAEACIG